MRRFVFIVLDGVGVGALPDAEDYGDEQADTLGNLCRLVDLDLPCLQSLGLGNLWPLRGIPPVTTPRGLPGRLAELSAGKDTSIGHWEHMGLVVERPLPTYPRGFPEEVLQPFRRRIGRDILGNKSASGTDIIRELGEEHLRTGSPIVYTSADSVFQVACHVDIVPLEELYRMCSAAREILRGPHAVARVIARPFAGPPGAFFRTRDRKDYSLEPTGPTYLDLLVKAGVPVIGVGKIHQIFAGRGVTQEVKVGSNAENLASLEDILCSEASGLVFSNLVDFDMVWGHRNDVEGFASGLEFVDRALTHLLDLLGPDDRLLLTADHGVDPTTPSTDHSREFAPLLYYPRPNAAPKAAYQGVFADTGATAFSYLTGKAPPLAGRPVDELIPVRGWSPYPNIPRRPGLSLPRVGVSEVRAAARFLAVHYGPPPPTVVVLGSGLGPAPFRLEDVVGLDGQVIPHWPIGKVAGHAGRLLRGYWRGRDLLLLWGRAHGYEGFDQSQLELPVRALASWGVLHMVLTNASGSLAPDLRPGLVAPVGQILDLQAVTQEGVRELPATEEPLLSRLVETTGLRGLTYVSVPGPEYETPLEAEILRSLGGDVVGMSAACEVRAARDTGMSAVVLTVVTNVVAAPSRTGEDGFWRDLHKEVVRVASAAGTEIADLVGICVRFWNEA